MSSARRPRGSSTSRRGSTLGIVVVIAAVAALAPARAAAEPVNALLPWHDAVLDARGGLLAWHEPRAGRGYDRVLRDGWTFLERGVPADTQGGTGLPVYLVNSVYDPATLQGVYWQHNPVGVYATLVDSLLGWYPYSGDQRAIAVVRRMLDYQLAHGTTPAGWDWPRVPFFTSCAFDREYGGCARRLRARVPRRRPARQGRRAGNGVRALPPAYRVTGATCGPHSIAPARSPVTSGAATRAARRGRSASTHGPAPRWRARSTAGSS